MQVITNNFSLCGGAIASTLAAATKLMQKKYKPNRKEEQQGFVSKN